MTFIASLLGAIMALTLRAERPAWHDSANPPMFDELGFPRDAELGDAAPALYHFVYCSRAADGVDNVEVGRIVESAQRNNLARGITGVLVSVAASSSNGSRGRPPRYRS